MAERPRAAVVVVNLNGLDFLPRTLESLAAQTVAPARTILVDNASTDGSPAFVRERFPAVEVIALRDNVGFAAANNLGIREAAECDWIALLNPDAYPEPRWLEALLRAAVESPGHSFFSSRMMSASVPDEIDGLGDAYHVSGLSWRREHGRVAAGRLVPSLPAETFSACAGAALYSRDALVAAGGFDESFFCYIEDSDLAFRLRLAGHRGRYVPDACVEHVGSALTGRESDFTLYHSNRNLVWTWAKNMPSRLLWLYLPQHLAINLLMLLAYGLKGRGGVVLRAKRDALRGLPRVLRQRAELQSRRVVGAAELRRVMETGLSAYQGTRARRPIDRLRGLAR